MPTTVHPLCLPDLVGNNLNVQFLIKSLAKVMFVSNNTVPVITKALMHHTRHSEKGLKYDKQTTSMASNCIIIWYRIVEKPLTLRYIICMKQIHRKSLTEYLQESNSLIVQHRRHISKALA